MREAGWTSWSNSSSLPGEFSLYSLNAEVYGTRFFLMEAFAAKNDQSQTKSQLELIFSRKSTGRLVEPAPNSQELLDILQAGASAPDHDSLRATRFIVFAGEDKDHFGEFLAQRLTDRLAAKEATPTEGQLNNERTKLDRAPLVIAVGVKFAHETKIPELEQYASAAASCENILLAATALGYGSMWRTGEICYDPGVKEALGLQSTDQIVAWLYIGSYRPDQPLEPAKSYSLEEVVSYYSR